MNTILSFTYSQIFLLVYVNALILTYIFSYGVIEAKHEKAIIEKYGRTSLGIVSGRLLSLLLIIWTVFSYIYFFNLDSSNWWYKIDILDYGIFKIIAILIMLFSFFLYILFVKSLGKSIKDTINSDNANQLITNGVYKYIRHPVYTAITASIFGTFLIIPNLIMLIFLILMIIIIIIHTQEEEKILIRLFGTDYQEYKRKVGKFLPRIKRNINNLNYRSL